MELAEWERLSEWVRAVWPQPGYDDEQVAATYFIVADLDADDAESALREHVLANGVGATPHPSEIRRLTNTFVRARRRPAHPRATATTEPPADDQQVSSILAGLRADLGRRPRHDPLALDGPALSAMRAKARTPAGPPEQLH